jgi:hypothetical protein
MRIANDIVVVGDWTRVEGLEQREGRFRVEDLDLPRILEREPNLGAVGCGGDIRAKRANLAVRRIIAATTSRRSAPRISVVRSSSGEPFSESAD